MLYQLFQEWLKIRIHRFVNETDLREETLIHSVFVTYRLEKSNGACVARGLSALTEILVIPVSALLLRPLWCSHRSRYL